MQKYVHTPTNLYCTFCKSVGHDEKDCRPYDLMHERSRDTYIIQGEVQQEGTMRNSTPQEEETSTLLEDSEEVWIEVEVRLFAITAHNQDIWQGIVRTLVPLATIVTCFIMSSNIAQYFWPNSRRYEEETNKSN
jgi:hypothetical protein